MMRGAADAGPHVAPHVLDPAFHLAPGLGSVGTAQPRLKAHPPGEVRHPPVPQHLAIFVLAQGHHFGVVVQAAPRHAAEILEGIHVALDEGGGVGLAHQFHVAGPRPAHGHHKHPDATLLPVLADVSQTPPSTWACSPSPVSNRIAASGCRHRRRRRTYSDRIV